jgi:signal recognition particle subunit SRP54
VVGIVRDELVSLLGKPRHARGLSAPADRGPARGLQGSGKTTFAGKLAVWLAARSKRTLLASADVYRPGGDRSARARGGQPERDSGGRPRERRRWRSRRCAGEARRRGFDFLVLDTARRLHVDGELMQELPELRRRAARIR